MITVRYSSNNSGGSWWLEDQDWRNLEAAGWTIEWAADSDTHNKFSEVQNTARWLGALATSAYKDFESIEDAIQEWEGITGQSADEEGCSCCGGPHDFYEKRD